MPIPPKPRRPEFNEGVQLDMLGLLVFLRQIPKREKPVEVKDAELWLEELAAWRCDIEIWKEHYG